MWNVPQTTSDMTDQRHENAERAVGPRHVEYHRQQQRREHPGGEEEEIIAT